jgi:hypothetical protein
MASPLDALRRFGSLARSAGGLIVSAASSTFAGASQGPPNVPLADYGAVQPAIATSDPEFRAGHHDHQYTPGVNVFSYDGITIEAARAIVSEHDTGVSFYRSSILAIALTRFGPVAAALGIRVAPSIRLERKINGGPRGLARRVALEVEDQLCPRAGLLPSACFPSTLWGALTIELAMMGFAVMQHVYGPPDERGVRRIYTRRWPTWAVRYDSWRMTYVAITTAGEVDITNDGKFTLIGKTDVPHLQGAIRSLAVPVLDGAQVQAARAQWINRYSDPKLVAFMPQGVGVGTDIGQAFMRALASLRNPGGFGALPHGSALQSVGLDSKASASFKEALDSDIALIYAILTGTDLSSGSGGVYTSPLFGDILSSTVGDDIAAQNRAINQGHVYPYTRFNHRDAIETDISRGVWVDPVLWTPLPDPKADARIESKAKHRKALSDQIVADKAAGLDVTQDHVATLAEEFGIETAPVLAATAVGAQSFGYDQENGIVTINQRLAELGKPLDDTGRGSMTVPEYRAWLSAETARKVAETEAELTGGETPPDGGTNEEPAAPAEEEAA